MVVGSKKSLILYDLRSYFKIVEIDIGGELKSMASNFKGNNLLVGVNESIKTYNMFNY